MALRDTSWITDTHFIETKHQVFQDVMTIIYGTIVTYRRVRKVTDAECIVLTEAAATNYADTHAGDTNTSYVAIEDNRYVGAWKLQRHIDSRAAYTADT